MERKRNLFDKIGILIRGYSGYANRDEKRNSDKILRDFISDNVISAETLVVSHQKELIKFNNLQTCQEWEVVRKSLNTLSSNIKYAQYGESSFFAESQLKEEELEEVYKMDWGIAESVDFLKSFILKHIEESISPIDVSKQIKAVETLIQKRAQFIRKFK